MESQKIQPFSLVFRSDGSAHEVICLFLKSVHYPVWKRMVCFKHAAIMPNNAPPDSEEPGPITDFPSAKEALESYRENKHLIQPISMTKNQIAKHYSVSLRTVDNWMKQGVVSFRKVGRRVFFDFVKVEEELSTHTTRRSPESEPSPSTLQNSLRKAS